METDDTGPGPDGPPRARSSLNTFDPAVKNAVVDALGLKGEALRAYVAALPSDIRRKVERRIARKADAHPTSLLRRPLERWVEPVSPLIPSPRLVGHKVLGLLGAGGMGIVVLAEEVGSGQRRALKLLTDNPARRHAHPMTSWMRQEAHLQQQLDHPNVVRLLEEAEHEGQPVLVMEFVEGPDLGRLLEGQSAAAPRLSVQEIHHVVHGMLQGMAHAHRHGVVHRDLKPSNVLLAIEDDGLVPRVADFGLAGRALPEPNAEPGLRTAQGAGTPQYRSPDQNEGAPPHPRMDVWSLGIVMFELIEGRRPTKEELRTIADRRPSRAEVPDYMWRAVQRALVAAPEARLPHADGLLAEWLAGAPPNAPNWRPETVSLARKRTPRAGPVRFGVLGSQAPRHTYVIGALADDRAILDRGEALIRDGRQVSYLLTDKAGTEWSATQKAMEEAIRSVNDVLVLWSSHAEVVQNEIELAVKVWVQQGAPRRFVRGESLDGTPLPAILDESLGTPTAPAVAAVIVSAFGLGLALWALPWSGGITRLALLGVLLLSGAGVVMQVMRRPDLMFRAGQLHNIGEWLDQASTRDVLIQAHAILHRIYGEQLRSWRALGTCAVISLVPMVLIGLIWGLTFAAGAIRLGKGEAITISMVSSLGSLSLTAPLTVGNILLDFLSLLVTGQVLTWLTKSRTLGRGWIALGIGLDALLVVAFAMATACTNVVFFLFYGLAGESWLSWPWFVLVTLGLLLTGQVHLSNALQDVFIGPALVCGVAMATAALPSLIHGTLWGLAMLNRAAQHLPAQWLGSALRKLAISGSTRRNLMPAALIGFTGALVVQPLWWGPGPPVPVWQPIDMGQCGDPCVIGCPSDEAWCGSHEPRRVVREVPADIHLLQTEVSQALWEGVWDQAWKQGLDRHGLARHPSVYRHPTFPADNVSWCDAARFANLWTAVDAATDPTLTPVYCFGEGCDARPRSVGDPSHALPQCEAAPWLVKWDQDAHGYRLPTDTEWEIAARAGTRTPWWTGADEATLLATEWLNPNSGWRPHRVTEVPDPIRAASHPFGLYGMGGNVAEWTWDNYRAAPGEPPEGRQVLPFLVGWTEPIEGWAADQFDPSAADGTGRWVRGGAWYAGTRSARSASRFALFPGFRFHTQGFRLVQPSGSAPTGTQVL